MNKGVPLEEYLQSQQSSSGMSVEDLDEHLFGSVTSAESSNSTVATAPQPSEEPLETKEEDDRFLSAIKSIQSRADRDEAIDRAVKAASHGVKVLGPLLAAMSKWVSPEDEPEKLDKLMGEVLSRVRTDAATVIEAYGFQKNEAPAWLTAQVSGQIMEVLVAAVERNNGAILDPNDQRYLAPFIKMAHETDGILEPQYGAASTRFALASTLAIATAEVMSEYYVFSYFHPNPYQVSEMVTDVLCEHVIDGTLDDLSERFGLSDDEISYLGNSLLKQAGGLLAAAWSRGQAATDEIVRSMPRSTRELVMTEGYPLDAVIEDFQASYQGVVIATEHALRALSPHRERLIDEQSHGPSLR